MQNRVNASLGANHLLENAHSLSRLTPLPLGVVVRDPDLWKKAAGVKLGQDHRVDLVRLNPGVSDRANHPRIRHDHALDERSQDPLDGGAVAGGLDDNLVLDRERLSEPDEAVLNEIDRCSCLTCPSCKNAACANER